MEKKCSICGKEFEGYVNNASPINEGCCCSDCNVNFVIPARMYRMYDINVNFKIVKNLTEYKEMVERLTDADFEYVGRNKYSQLNQFMYQNVATLEKVILCVLQ